MQEEQEQRLKDERISCSRKRSVRLCGLRKSQVHCNRKRLQTHTDDTVKKGFPLMRLLRRSCFANHICMDFYIHTIFIFAPSLKVGFRYGSRTLPAKSPGKALLLFQKVEEVVTVHCSAVGNTHRDRESKWIEAKKSERRDWVPTHMAETSMTLLQLTCSINLMRLNFTGEAKAWPTLYCMCL